MKKTLLLCVLFALSAPRLWAAVDPADRFLNAYFLIQEGDAAERQESWDKAIDKYNGALEMLREIETTSPDWNPHIIKFRINYCNEHLNALKSRITPPPAPEPAPTPAAAPEAPPAVEAPAPAAPATDSERIQELTAELQKSQQQIRELQTGRRSGECLLQFGVQFVATGLQQALAGTTTGGGAAVDAATQAQLRELRAGRDELNGKLQEALKKIASMESVAAELQKARVQIRDLEAARAEVNAKLQAALAGVTPSQTTPQIEELLKKNTDLAAQLAAAQTEISRLREPGGAAAAEPTEMDKLRTELTEARAEIERSKQELQQSRDELAGVRKELETVQTQNQDLRKNYDDIVAQLTEANRQLTAAQTAGSKDDEIIRQLRKENALLRLIADRKSVSTRATEESSGPTIPELKGWRPWRRKERETVRAREPREEAPAVTTEQSAQSKLVATMTAPPAPRPVERTETPAPPAPAAPSRRPRPASKPFAPPPEPPVVASATPPAPGESETISTVPPASAATPQPPSSPEVRTLMNEGRAAIAAKDLETASAKYDQVLTIEPGNLTALSNLGVVRYQQGRIDEAEDILRKAVALAPNDSATRSLLGVIYFRKGRVEDAFTELTRAVALNPRNAEAHNYLGITLHEKGWASSAEQEVRKAIELNPTYADAHFNMAVLYVRQKTPRYELARYHYQKALDLGAQPDPAIETLLKKEAGATEAQPPKPQEPATPPTKTEAPAPLQPAVP
jgi:Flp pilus assembly protein TadD/uncharacterized coiled-coil DUF342 family protein